MNYFHCTFDPTKHSSNDNSFSHVAKQFLNEMQHSSLDKLNHLDRLPLFDRCKRNFHSIAVPLLFH